MRKIIMLIMAIVLIALLVACGQSTNQTKSVEPTNNTESASMTTSSQTVTEKSTESPTETPTEIPTNPSTEAPTEPPTDPPIDTSKSVSRIEAFESYASVLSEKDEGRFDLIYINNDNIPELVYFIGDAHLNQVSVYTYHNGNAAYLGDVGAYGTIAYSEKNNRIFGYTGIESNPELEAKYTYMIQNGSLANAPDYENYVVSTSYCYDGIKNTDYTRQMLSVGGLGK